jgi:integrase
MAGLRLAEIDSLTWDAFNWRSGRVRIEKTEYAQLKSEDSAREVDLDPEVMALFKGFHARAKSVFVIESERGPDPHAPSGWYRCQPVREKLYRWLREKGVTDKKPFHVLRKEFGSLINDKYGIFAAKDALGHSQISTTAQHYVDRRRRTPLGMGHLLKSPQNVIEIPRRGNEGRKESNALLGHSGAMAGHSNANGEKP